MRKMTIATCVVCALSQIAFAAESAAKKKILFFSLSCGFQHSTVTRPKDKPDENCFAEKKIKEFGEKAGYEVSVSQDSKDLQTDEQFNKYDCIIFYTTGNPDINREAFVKWLQSGKAFIGIHCATDTFENNGDAKSVRSGCSAKAWPEYNKIIGAAFKTHCQQQEVAIKVEDPKNSITKAIPGDWKVTDEIYLFRESPRTNCHVLLSIDTDKMDNGVLEKLCMKKGEDYPVSWTHTEGKGRVFYTSLGHREDMWENPKWQQQLMAGIAWVMHQHSGEKSGKAKKKAA